jgi:N-dimethylarginine dimethylaminohydrolase
MKDTPPFSASTQQQVIQRGMQFIVVREEEAIQLSSVHLSVTDFIHHPHHFT